MDAALRIEYPRIIMLGIKCLKNSKRDKLANCETLLNNQNYRENYPVTCREDRGKAHGNLCNSLDIYRCS